MKRGLTFQSFGYCGIPNFPWNIVFIQDNFTCCFNYLSVIFLLFVNKNKYKFSPLGLMDLLEYPLMDMEAILDISEYKM